MVLEKLKNKSRIFYGSIIFIIFELIAFIIIHSSKGLTCSITTFSSILLAFLFALIFLRKTPIYLLTVTALFLTSIADLLLCGLFALTLSIQTTSVICFFVVQICYFIRIYLSQKSKKLKLIHLIVRILATLLAVIITILILDSNANFLAVISVAYYLNLIINAIFASINVKNEPLFFIGLLLFMLCDFFVGIEFLGDFINIESATFINFLMDIPFNMAWLFYLPSQTIISLDIANKKRT